MRVVAIIQARMGSTRLPGKVLMPLVGKPVLWHIIHRLRKCKTLDSIALATTTNSCDDPLEEFAEIEGIEVIRGSEDNVLERYYIAAKTLHADIVIRVTGDAPLIDPDYLDLLVNYLIRENVDFVMEDHSIPSIHEGFSPFTFHALEKLINVVGDDPVAREHVTAYFKKNPSFISSISIKPESDYQFKGARLSVDTPADLQFLEEIYKRLQVPAGEADIREVVKLLRHNPDLLLINSHVYQKKADDKTRRILFSCEGNIKNYEQYLERCIKLAQKLRDTYGFGIKFSMGHGQQGIEMIHENGFKIETKASDYGKEWLGEIIEKTLPDAIVFNSMIAMDSDCRKKIYENGIVVVIINGYGNSDPNNDILDSQSQGIFSIRISNLTDLMVQKIVIMILERNEKVADIL